MPRNLHSLAVKASCVVVECKVFTNMNATLEMLMKATVVQSDLLKKAIGKNKAIITSCMSVAITIAGSVRVAIYTHKVLSAYLRKTPMI
jgi:hypothetical protein